MSARLRLETFDAQGDAAESPDEPAHPTLHMSAQALEDVRAQAHASGFRAGFNAGRDASRQADDRRREALEDALLALSFTYQEARHHILGAMTPLLHAMVETVVPDAAHTALAAHFEATLKPIAASLSEPPVTILVNPASRPDIEAILARAEAPPAVVRDSPDLGPAQLQLRFDSQERRIDLDEVLDDMRAILRDELELPSPGACVSPLPDREKDARHG